MYAKWFQLSSSRTLIRRRNSLLSSSVTETFLVRCKRSERKWHCLKLQTSNFHTTQKLRYPMSLTTCFGSIICGYFVRKWWLKQDPIQKEMYIRWYRQRRQFFHGAFGVVSIILIIYCLSCFQRDPVLKIPRFILYDQAQRMENAKILFQFVVQNKQNVVPLSNPMYSRVAAVIRKLGSCNREIFQDTEWTVTIIRRMFDIASVPNVLILPDKNIVIISDIFNFIKSNDQLTFILAHEMSHEMLLHTSETLSLGLVFDVAAAAFSFLIWALFSVGVASILCSCMYLFSSIMFSWYKRCTEAEADAVGLKLAAKSCIDLREVLVFWEIMKAFEELSGQTKFQIPLFMQHPPLEERERRTIQMMPKALELRRMVKCPPLPASDPRDRLPMYKKDIENYLHKGPRLLGMRL